MARSYSYTPAVYDANVIATLVGVARERGLGVDHQLAALSCGIVEDNLNHSASVRDGTSVGWRQETRSSYPPPIDRMDLPASVHRFYDELGPAKPVNRTIGSWVQSVQRSAYPDEYDAALPVARQVLDAVTAGTPFPGSASGTGTGAAQDGYYGPDLGPAPENRATLTPSPAALDSPLYGPTEIQFGNETTGRLTASVLTASVRRSVDEAATLDVTFTDPDRVAVRSAVLHAESLVSVAGVNFMLTDVDAGDPPLVTATFTDAAAAALMRPGGPQGTAAAGTVTRGGWMRSLAEQAMPGVTTEVEEGDWVVGGTMGRGSEQDPDEPVWDALRRAADEIGWRRYVDLNRLFAGSDEFLYARFNPVEVREHHNGVGYLRFGWHTVLQSETASFVCDAALWHAAPGTPVVIPNMGLATGEWLIETVERSLGSTETSVSLVRRRRELPEPPPLPQVEAGEGTAGGVASGGPVVSGAASPQGYTWPMSGPQVKVISEWGAVRGGGTRSHKGIDIGAPVGHPVYAARAGVVSRVVNTDTGNPGLRVVLDHGDAVTDYMHNSRNLVSVGLNVQQGQLIAECGKTGNARTTPPHVHFEIRPGGVAQNPRKFLP